MNLRSTGLSKTLPVLATEVILRAKVALDARSRTGEWGRMSANDLLRRNEMLAAGHGTTGLAAVGKVVISLPAENALALRHLNVPALARAGRAGWKVAQEHRERAAARRVVTWEELLRSATAPWELDELRVIEDRVVVSV